MKQRCRQPFPTAPASVLGKRLTMNLTGQYRPVRTFACTARKYNHRHTVLCYTEVLLASLCLLINYWYLRLLNASVEWAKEDKGWCRKCFGEKEWRTKKWSTQRCEAQDRISGGDLMLNNRWQRSLVSNALEQVAFAPTRDHRVCSCLIVT